MNPKQPILLFGGGLFYIYFGWEQYFALKWTVIDLERKDPRAPRSMGRFRDYPRATDYYAAWFDREIDR